MFATLTGLGLSTAAGLNAYIPLMVVGVLANVTDAIKLPEEYAWLSNGWVLGIIGVLLLAEFVLDKVPVVDHVNDIIQTAVRPAAGGVVFSATSAASQLDNSTWMAEHPAVGWMLGIVTALIVHLVKSGTRPVVNATTAGVGAPVVSTVEDAGSLSLSLVAVFLPVLVLVFLAGMIAIGWVAVRRMRRFKQSRALARAART
ncbi:DUF4126 domain-containing protein [Herbidospora cretacea]|uniref:DUF4126 domain-containing protein n=1 Tax=Herbidospora cretacea TaxID=28444 RepID=UPI000773ED21|nr:DUF4126 domain-containing protein [Herbidospora cretacea]